MNKQKLIVFGAIAAVIIIIYVIYRRFIQPQFQRTIRQDLPPNKNTTSTGSTSGTSYIKGDDFPLQKGSSGSNVTALQKILGVSADGKFGPKTEAAVNARLGKVIVTSDDFNSLKSGGSSEGKTVMAVNKDVESDSDVANLVIDIEANLKEWYIVGRTEEYPWNVLATQRGDKLKKIADKYQATYGRSLYSAVDDAHWHFTTDVDNRIKSALEAINLKA